MLDSLQEERLNMCLRWGVSRARVVRLRILGWVKYFKTLLTTLCVNTWVFLIIVPIEFMRFAKVSHKSNAKWRRKVLESGLVWHQWKWWNGLQKFHFCATDQVNWKGKNAPLHLFRTLDSYQSSTLVQRTSM